MLYGCWLDQDFDCEAVASRLKEVKSQCYSSYPTRVNSICALAELFIARSCARYPSLQGKISLSYPAIISAIGRYINDVMHYKLWHDVKLTNQAKMIAHTIKWLSHYPVISINLNADDYAGLSEEERWYVLELNTLFIGTVVRYFLSFFSNGDVPSANTYGKIFYLLDTGQYDVKTAAVAFDGLLI